MLDFDFDSKTFSNFFDGFPMPASGLLSDDDMLNSLRPILAMARSNKLEAQLEASRMLCDLSMRDDIQQHLCDSGCLSVLVQVLLPSAICEQISQHALLALANLSEAQSCQVGNLQYTFLQTSPINRNDTWRLILTKIFITGCND